MGTGNETIQRFINDLDAFDRLLLLELACQASRRPDLLAWFCEICDLDEGYARQLFARIDAFMEDLI